MTAPKHSDENNAPPKSYETPEVVRVSLRPDEAVLGHCKVPGVSGPGNASCGALFCRTIGS